MQCAIPRIEQRSECLTPSVNCSKERRKFLKDLGEEIENDEGHRLIVGDFNFVLDAKIDKRGEKSTAGQENQ